MHICLKSAAIVCALACPSALSIGAISDFWVSDISGGIYEVDGETFEATYVRSISSMPLSMSMLYQGGDTLLVNDTQRLFTIDLSDGSESDVVSSTDLGDGLHGIFGLADAGEGEVFFMLQRLPTAFSSNSGVVYDLSDGSGEFVEFGGVPDFYTDFLLIGDNRFFGVTGQGRSYIVDLGAATVQQVQFDVANQLVTMFEDGGDRYGIDTQGRIFEMDLDALSLAQVGAIDFDIQPNGGVIGSAVPAPSAMVLLGLGGLVGVRRRR